jgi:hypothetical protein
MPIPAARGMKLPPVATIAVANQIVRLLVPRSRLGKLAPHPFSSRMGGDVGMNQPAAVVSDEEEDVEGLESERLHREEIGRPDVRRVIAQEGAPTLRRRATPVRSPVPSHGLSADR